MGSFKHLVILSSLAVISLSGYAQTDKIYHKGWIDFNKNGKMDIYEDSSAAINDRIEDLISQMTIEEKAGQCATLYGYRRSSFFKDSLPTADWDSASWKHGIANIDEHLNGIAPTEFSYPYSRHAEALNRVQRWFVENTRLGIPVDFSTEGIHGLNHDRATPLPAPITIGSTWSKSLVRQAGEIAGREAKALGYSNVYAPILDLARDPRWGRVLECYGEDPFLVASLGGEMVSGIQSQGVASTLKHYAVYSVPKGGRDGFTRTDPHVAPRELHQLHLYPYRQIIKQHKPMGVMSSYNDWDGIPIAASYYFLTELLRQDYGFDGYVVSDSDAIEYVHNKHRVAPTYKDAVRQVAEAGQNVRTTFSDPAIFTAPLIELMKEGKLSTAVVNRNVADVLRVKFKLGLFDAPYTKDPKEADRIVAGENTAEFIKQMARESIVLLKNEDNTLPLDIDKLDNILITGPLATDTTAYVSRYGPQNITVTNVLDGITNYVGTRANIDFELGCEIVDQTWPESEIIPTPLTVAERELMARALAKAEKADVIIAVMGEDEKRCGENKTRTGLDLPGRQRDYLMELKKIGKPIILILINGQPLTINWENRYIPAIVEAWFPNAYGGSAIAETIFGDNNPGGKLPITFPKSIGQIEWNFPFKPYSHGWQAQKGYNGTGITSVDGALYPFGYGLSYTTFEYSNLVVSPERCGVKGSVDISFDIINSGDRAGDEIVQLYFRDMVSSVTTYEYQLRGFERVKLEAGESKTVHFTLKSEDFELLDRDMHWVTEPGEFEILVGANSEDIRLTKMITLE